jgi:hypothetical protein
VLLQVQQSPLGNIDGGLYFTGLPYLNCTIIKVHWPDAGVTLKEAGVVVFSP